MLKRHLSFILFINFLGSNHIATNSPCPYESKSRNGHNIAIHMFDHRKIQFVIKKFIVVWQEVLANVCFVTELQYKIIVEET